MKKISVVTPCYNEEGNVELLHKAVVDIFTRLGNYRLEHIFIDNASVDGTADKIKEMAKTDKSVKLIVNTRNFGHIRSPMHAFFQARGDAVILMAADFQDPPELLEDFIRKWENGYKIIIGVKKNSEEFRAMWLLRRAYYRFVKRISDIDLIQDFTGFGLYDREVVEHLRSFKEPYPYFRGQIAELGHETKKIPFSQPVRKRGITKNNFYTLYDIAMLGITTSSKVPLRLATMAGFILSIISLLIAFFYIIIKLLFWNAFSVGMAPLIFGVYFLGSVQLFFIGILGEYIGAIHTNVRNRPYVIEKERINFDDNDSTELS